jgi:5-methylcytosine-specific restriction enzyme B
MYTSIGKNIWIEKTIVKGRKDRIEGERALGLALWSPKTGSDGRNTYKNMTLVNSGDLILHFTDNKQISGISEVEKSAIEVDGLQGTPWNVPSYLIKLCNFIELENPVDRIDLLSSSNRTILHGIAENSEVFYNSDLTLRQGGYLTPCPIALLALINKYHKNNNGNNIPLIPDSFINELNNLSLNNFNNHALLTSIKNTGLTFSSKLTQRFVSSLLTKPFVICSGLSGSGKTKLAQAFVQWISENENQYKIIPVGADWTNREPLLGYPNGLDPKSYITPDSGALQLMIEANNNSSKPYFLILDEMNLSHVERYFADFLSIMESGESIKLYSGADRMDSASNPIPKEIGWPKNLFIIGTVNIDETTYMFSPKVLDRANVIEFRITPEEMKNFFNSNTNLDMNKLFIDGDKSKGGLGQEMGESFFQLASEKSIVKIPEIDGDQNILNKFFIELQNVGSEFGYRSAMEMELLITKLGLDCLNDETGKPIENNVKIDIAIMQKLLPKVHGSRKKLVLPLETLAGFCLKRTNESQEVPSTNVKSIYQQYLADTQDKSKWTILYPISFEKIERMYKNVIDNGFTSYAEA